MKLLLIGLAILFAALGGGRLEAEPLVQCKSGLYCPSGMKCLPNLLCGRHVRLHGCWPGEVESKKVPGKCLPAGYVDCGLGYCYPGERCGPRHKCLGGTANGPVCSSGAQCHAGGLCNPYDPARCYDPRVGKFCGRNFCNIRATCGEADECLHIVDETVPQSPYLRYPGRYHGPTPPRMPDDFGGDNPYIQTGPNEWAWPDAPCSKLNVQPDFDAQIDPAAASGWKAKDQSSSCVLAENPEEARARKDWFSRTDRPTKAPDEKDAKSFRIGAVGALRGEAYWVWPDGKKTPIRAGEPAFFGNKIITGSTGRVQLLLLDDTVFTAGPNSDMKIDEFVYDPAETTKNKLVATITKGIFRFVTGKVARNDPANMKVNLPVGTIGERGTEIECKVEPDGSGYLKVFSGEATFTNKFDEQIVVKIGQTVTFDRSGRFDGQKKTVAETPVIPETKSAADVVRQFYAALGKGQGDVASQLVVPEKRASGPFSPAQLTQFYGHLIEPISLLDLAAQGQDAFLVRYHYVASKLQCNGRAIVKTVIRDGQYYIESIRALSGC